MWAHENYEAKIEDPNAADETETTLYQYGRLGFSLLPEGKDVRLQAFLSGRFRQELEEAAEEDAHAEAAHAENPQIYAAYADVSIGPYARTRLRVGRQFVPNAVGFWKIDGINVRRRFGRLSGTAYIGVGGPSWLGSDEQTGVVGGQVDGRFGIVTGRLGLLLATEGVKPSDIGNLYLTGGFDVIRRGPMGIHPGNRTFESLSVDVAFEPFYTRIARASLRSRFRLGPGVLTVRGRFDMPQFPYDSIFRVFAAEARTEATFAYSWPVQRWLRVNVRHIEQFFDEANARRERVELAAYHGFERIAVFGVELLKWGGAHRRYVVFRLQKQLTPNIRAAVGNRLNDYRLHEDGEDLSARSLQGEIQIRLTREVSLFARVAKNSNPLGDNVRVFAYVRASFSTRGGTR